MAPEKSNQVCEATDLLLVLPFVVDGRNHTSGEA